MKKWTSRSLKTLLVTGLAVTALLPNLYLSPASAAETVTGTVTATEVVKKLPKVQVIATGGTLAGQSTDETSFQTYRAGSLPIADLVASLPNKDQIAEVSTYQFGNSGSSAYTIEQLYDLSLKVDEALKTQDGVVVTTGTDTMEEIAYFLDLTVRSPKPVVVTGSMRPWTVIGTDAPANLYNAIKLAASGKTKYFGTVVMLNDEFHAAREVTKTNSYRTDTFVTPEIGALGYIDEKTIRVYRAPFRALKSAADWATPFDLSKISKKDLAKVEIAYSYQDAGAGAISGFVANGAKGIVTAGTGAGGISKAMTEERKAAIEKGVVFVTTTRTGSGSNYSSGEGIIAGDNLNAAHARILLLLCLSFSNDFDTVKDWFTTVGYGQIELPAK
ncbi:asparaginase [Paenibacillus phoenicis]|uniref:Asparaginase n=1 Tax=Paenibacillus phoenicis TaxID=554117 RepID=A0ABU5PIQ6_9BACL|nr:MULTISPECIES: asparaginase [Paenibacillus]EES72086.1 L-asparaginase, type II [Paenibacillus sp. oral taxon 786 str. D14]MEA3569838.1 asparaginase [Paenibacillus phoenicis]